MSGDYYWYGDNGGWLGYQNEFIFAWTSTTTDSTKAINLGVHNNNLNPVSEYSKNVGMALRSTTARRYPLSYVFSGFYGWGDGFLRNQDSSGDWWSTAAYSGSNDAYTLYMGSSGLYPQNNDNKAYGFSLR
ncbi:hypothetical protein IJG78_01815 [Candidatus Saccharibacteria bacterium]|nr:hypothetical protein [Candidatus Saccharibacteria bacterium]MBQ3469807.1 hypothetical protein [Candidatus Saccharibacteria bacterium]